MHDIFFFTDIHGMYDLYRAIMDYCQEQDPEAMIIFGGDACDRGQDGYKIMKELLDNPKVIYLKGNHEDLFVKAAKEIYSFLDFKDMNKEEINEILKATVYHEHHFLNIQNSLYNSGLSTLTDWIMDDMPMDFVKEIDKLPLTFSMDNCDFCHAAGVYTVFKRVNDAEYNQTPINPDDAELVMWTRSAFNIGWKPNRTAIFGHTPVPYLYEYKKHTPHNLIEPYKWYSTDIFPEFTGAKIDMDTGAAFTGNAYVLSVLTMKAQGFEDIDVSAKEKVHHDVKKIDCIQM